MNKYDVFEIMAEEQELLNVTIGRLRMAIKLDKGKERLEELLERISRNVQRRGIID